MTIPRILAAALALGLPAAAADGFPFTESFEAPTVRSATPINADLRPEIANAAIWQRARDRATGTDGTFVEMGYTPSTASTGSQSLYVTFRETTVKYSGAYVATRPLPAEPGRTYRISAFIKNDATNPVTGDAVLNFTARFLASDALTLAGKETYGGGRADSGARNVDPLDWREVTRMVTAPDDAAFLVVTFTVQRGEQEIPTTGTVYLDDLSVTPE